MKKNLLVILFIGYSLAIAFGQNPRNVLVYNLTDTDCGPCSCMDSIIHHKLQPTYPRTIVVALHSPMFNSFFREYQGKEIFYYFNEKFEPSGFIDGQGRDVNYARLTDSVGHRYSVSPEAPVQITVESKTWDPVSRNVTLKMNATNLGPEINRPCSFNIFVTEDNLIANHRIFNGCATPNVPNLPFKYDFVNDHVTRKVEYYHQGEPLVGPTWPNGQTVTRLCTVQLDSSWVESNCNLVVTIYEHDDSLYKAPVLQAIREGIDQRPARQNAILNLYPNPASGWVNVHLSVAGTGHYFINLTDIKGNTLVNIPGKNLSEGIYNVELNTSSYPPGVYLVTFGTPEGEVSRQLVIR